MDLSIMTELLGIVVVDCESTTGEKLYKVDIMDTTVVQSYFNRNCPLPNRFCFFVCFLTGSFPSNF